MNAELARQALSFVNITEGTIDRRIFHDPAVYDLEMEQIFARAWIFMCHETQIPNPGDFFLNFMGEDRVIVVRNNDGGISVLVNSCRHRGNAVCRADEGHATSFMCTYHGWTYDLNGALVGVPGFKEVYHEELDREKWGLIRAAKVESYKGFVFATMDGSAPTLHRYLAEGGRFALDTLADQGDLRIVGGIEKYCMEANWKFPHDNSVDYYHGGLTHASAAMAGWNQRRNLIGRRGEGLPGTAGQQRDGIAVLSEFGHVCGMPFLPDGWETSALADDPVEQWRFDPEVRRRMGPLKSKFRAGFANIFPNLFVAPSTRQVAIRMPKGPSRMELWYFTLADATLSPEAQRESGFRALHTFGASGMLEQEDGENWAQSTIAMRGVISSRYPLNYAMGLGHNQMIADENGPLRMQGNVRENFHMWQYRAWSEMISAPSWADWDANHSMPSDAL